MSKTTVAIVQRRLTHYRVPLFTALRELLNEQDIRVRLLHGQPTAQETLKNDSGTLDWAEHLPTRYFANGKLMWQPFAQATAGCDLVIVTQENKHLNNLPPVLSPWRRQKLAFWGHGRNMQSANPNGPGERFKRWTTKRVDWWFAYTELSAKFVRDDGYPGSRITVLNNSIDTSALRRAVEHAAQATKASVRAALGLHPEGPVGLFIGSLYTDKRLDFLVAAAAQIRQQVPSFQLLLAGDGPQRDFAQAATAQYPWVKWLGSVHGERKAQCLAASDLMLNPGLVGLGILDAFVAGLPLMTTDCGLHSPEIAYLQDGQNGQMTANTLPAFTRACVDLLVDPNTLRQMQSQARESAENFSVAAMAHRFSAGIQAALAAPKT